MLNITKRTHKKDTSTGVLRYRDEEKRKGREGRGGGIGNRSRGKVDFQDRLNRDREIRARWKQRSPRTTTVKSRGERERERKGDVV